MKTFNFSEVTWGKDDSKHDSSLLNYFVTIPEYDGLINGEYRFIVGRKGTGKTAICQYLRLKSQNDPLWFNRYLSLRNFPITELRKLEDKSLSEKSKYVPIWKFLMLCDLAEMIVEDQNSIDYETRIEIGQFLENNFPSQFTFADTLSVLKENNRKVSVANKWVGGKEENDLESSNFSATINYQKATDILIQKMKRMTSESTFFLIIDELDEGWRAGDSRLRLILLALLRAVEDIAAAFDDSGLKIRPILALRSDIFDSLEDGDLNKYDDYIVRLRWTARSGRHPLKAIVNARIASAFGLPLAGQYWDSVADERDRHINSPHPSLWKWITNRTLERPRDVIKFLKECRKVSKNGKLTLKQVETAEKSYSEWFYNELRDEIQSHIEVWRETIDAISKVGLVKIKDPSLLTAEFQNDAKISHWLSERKKNPDHLLHELFEFGIIGNIKANGYWQFKYKNEDALIDPSEAIVIHYGLMRKLSLRNNFIS